MKKVNSTFGDYLKYHRLKKGLTITKAAELMNVTIASLSNYENNKLNPSEKTLEKIAEVYDVPIKEIELVLKSNQD